MLILATVQGNLPKFCQRCFSFFVSSPIFSHVQQTTECSCRKLLLSFISFDVFTSCCLACQITFLKRHKTEANQTGCMFAICDVTPYVQQVSNADWMVMVSSNPTVVKILCCFQSRIMVKFAVFV